MQGPLREFVNQAADTFDGNGDSFRNALRELSQTAGRLGDSRTDLFGTVRNLQMLVNALSNSNEQIVQFTGQWPRCRRCWPTARRGWTTPWARSTRPCRDVRGFLDENNETLIARSTS